MSDRGKTSEREREPDRECVFCARGRGAFREQAREFRESIEEILFRSLRPGSVRQKTAESAAVPWWSLEGHRGFFTKKSDSLDTFSAEQRADGFLTGPL